jgi:SHAQKYF class myb-like DNA-binding protein
VSTLRVSKSMDLEMSMGPYPSKTPPNGGRWSKPEHHMFLLGLELYGNDWRRISWLVQTRTALQTRSHAQKHLKKRVEKDVKAVVPARRSTMKTKQLKAISVPNVCANKWLLTTSYPTEKMHLPTPRYRCRLSNCVQTTGNLALHYLDPSIRQNGLNNTPNCRHDKGTGPFRDISFQYQDGGDGFLIQNNCDDIDQDDVAFLLEDVVAIETSDDDLSLFPEDKAASYHYHHYHHRHGEDVLASLHESNDMRMKQQK